MASSFVLLAAFNPGPVQRPRVQMGLGLDDEDLPEAQPQEVIAAARRILLQLDSVVKRL